MKEINLRYIEINDTEIIFKNFDEDFEKEGKVTFFLFPNGIVMMRGDETADKEKYYTTEYKNNKITDSQIITKIKSMNFPNIIKFVKVKDLYIRCEEK